MNVRLTANPEKASRITPSLRIAPSDLTQGERLYRAMPRVGDLDEDARSFRAVVATSTPVQRRDAKGPFLEVLDPKGPQFNEDDDFPLLTDHKQAARETVGRVSGLTIDGPSVSATLRIGMVDDIEPLFERVRDGVIRHVSAGYSVLQWTDGNHPPFNGVLA